jgi:hypothetical protein
MKASGGVEVYLHSLLTSTLGGDGGSFTPWLLNQWEECLLTHWFGGWKGPRAGLDVLEKRKSSICWELNPRLSMFKTVFNSQSSVALFSFKSYMFLSRYQTSLG